ncbi:MULTISPECIES: HAD family hydrolase [Flavobacteriaceae]|uniref:HAD family hydrolase n=1 Tax=Flavobacteriaceae TaxID=49546 RepID=UPI0014922B4C|nr:MULTISPECIES: HAD family hydrolase [Allomuricauda]MDC6367764.1 HAD family hydrolase [Muricauda sp. AC10]
MDLSQIKMVVTDMDGTLLNSNHEVSNQFFEIFDELKKRNIKFVAASGRQYHSMVDKLKTIQDDIIFISENGAYVKQMEKVLLTTPIDQTNVHTILSAISSVENAHPVLCSKDNAYVNGESSAFIEMLKEYYSEFEVVVDQTKVEDDVLKVAIYHFDSSEKYIYPAVSHLEDQLKVKVSGSNWVDVSHQNAHKGFALEKLMQQYGIASNEIMVFGDYNNDLEMLQLSDYSFAMANAHPNVHKVAQYTTASNNEFGVEKVLEKLL